MRNSDKGSGAVAWAHRLEERKRVLLRSSNERHRVAIIIFKRRVTDRDIRTIQYHGYDSNREELEERSRKHFSLALTISFRASSQFCFGWWKTTDRIRDMKATSIEGAGNPFEAKDFQSLIWFRWITACSPARVAVRGDQSVWRAHFAKRAFQTTNQFHGCPRSLLFWISS